jgi:hypothetical protein
LAGDCKWHGVEPHKQCPAKHADPPWPRRLRLAHSRCNSWPADGA